MEQLIALGEEALDALSRGGWPMIPLAACSLLAGAVVIERAAALRRRAVLPPRIVRLIEDYNGEAAAEGLLDACRRSPSPLGQVAAEVLRARTQHYAQVIEVMYAAGRTQTGRLERGLTLLEIVAGVSPLLGLLGTVLGMLRTFEAVSLHGIGNPQVLSQGISQALVTTIAGLCVAIPALACHSLLSRRVDDLGAELQTHAVAFIAKLAPQAAPPAPARGETGEA